MILQTIAMSNIDTKAVRWWLDSTVFLLERQRLHTLHAVLESMRCISTMHRWCCEAESACGFHPEFTYQQTLPIWTGMPLLGDWTSCKLGKMCICMLNMV